ncbi:MAG TPA: hypothetical protein EYP80_02195 [Candidatus Aenigmarchaeota archaeon]|nr:hypothetical protein [Candidatus Aenigmarchaeota archaeon]
MKIYNIPLRDSLIEVLNRKEELRNRIFDLCRKGIRSCARTINALHRSDIDKAENLITETEELRKQIAKIVLGTPWVYHGIVSSFFQEYTEAHLFYCICKDLPLKSYKELAVREEDYILGLADLTGEISRNILDSLRKDGKNIYKLFQIMEDIYEFLVEIDTPDSLIPGLRHKKDVLRGQLQKIREILVLYKINHR